LLFCVCLGYFSPGLLCFLFFFSSGMAKNGVTGFIQELGRDPFTWTPAQALEFLEASSTSQGKADIVANGPLSSGNVRSIAAGIIRRKFDIAILLGASTTGKVGQYNMLDREAVAAAFNTSSSVIQSLSQTLPGPSASPSARVVAGSGARMNADIAVVAASGAVTPVPAQAASAATQIRLMNERADSPGHPAGPAGEAAEDEKEPRGGARGGGTRGGGCS
jgi:hypothetical protein